MIRECREEFDGIRPWSTRNKRPVRLLGKIVRDGEAVAKTKRREGGPLCEARILTFPKLSRASVAPSYRGLRSDVLNRVLRPYRRER